MRTETSNAMHDGNCAARCDAAKARGWRGARIGALALVVTVAVLLPSATGRAEPGAGHRLPPPPWLGSWGQYVKPDARGSTPWHDDIPGLVQALLDTGQNWCIYPVTETIDWEDFNLLLDTVRGTDIRVFAFLGARGGANGDLRWNAFEYSKGVIDGDAYADGDPPTACDEADYTDEPFEALHACEREYILDWLDAWKNAARSLSHLSRTNPNLAGLVIDDFDSYVESVIYPSGTFGTRLTRKDVAELAAAAHSGNGRFIFAPVCYYKNFGQAIGDGYVLGTNYGVKLFENEEMRVDLDFAVQPSTASVVLDFFHRDNVTDCTPWNVLKQVRLDGTPIWTESVGGDEGIERYRQPIDLAGIPPGHHVISLALDPVAGVDSENTECGGVYWQVWGLHLRGNRRSIGHHGLVEFEVPLHARYATVSNEAPYTPIPGCLGRDLEWCPSCEDVMTNTDERLGCSRLPDDAVHGFARRRLLAAPSRPYLIDGIVDAIVAPFYDTQDFPGLQACDAHVYAPYGFDPDDYRAMLEATKAELHGARLMALHLGMEHSFKAVDLTNLEAELRISAPVADWTGLWDSPLPVRYLDEHRGIFSDSRDESTGTASFTDCDGTHWNFLAYWPGRQAGMLGWFVQWSLHALPTARTVTVDLGDCVPDGDTKGLTQGVAVQDPTSGTTMSYFSHDLGDELSRTVLADWPMSITVPANQVLVLSVFQDDTVTPPASAGSAYFNVEDDAGNAMGADSGDWDFATGADDSVTAAYAMETEVFLDLRP